MPERRESLAAALLAEGIRVEPAKADLLKTRRTVIQAWRAASRSRRRDGELDIAAEADRFLTEMPPPQTER